MFPINLIDLPTHFRYNPDAKQQAARILQIHEQVKENIIKANERYSSKANKSIGRWNSKKETWLGFI